MDALPNKVDGPEPLSLKELTTLLVRHYDFHEGIWDLSVEMRIGAGPVGPTPEAVLPSTIVSVSRIGLQKAVQLGPTVVDAAVVNPKSG